MFLRRPAHHHVAIRVLCGSLLIWAAGCAHVTPESLDSWGATISEDLRVQLEDASARAAEEREALQEKIDSLQREVTDLRQASDEYHGALERMGGSQPTFPWWPPDGYKRLVLRRRGFPALTTKASMGDVDQWLSSALFQAGFTDVGYFVIPHGFALVAQLDDADAHVRSAADKKPWPIGIRWLAGLGGALGDLFKGRGGDYFLLSFIVSTEPFGPNDEQFRVREAMSLAGRGFNVLPRVVATSTFEPNCVVTALLYEFKTVEPDQPAVKVQPSIEVRDYLARSGLLKLLGG